MGLPSWNAIKKTLTGDAPVKGNNLERLLGHTQNAIMDWSPFGQAQTVYNGAIKPIYNWASTDPSKQPAAAPAPAPVTPVTNSSSLTTNLGKDADGKTIVPDGYMGPINPATTVYQSKAKPVLTPVEQNQADYQTQRQSIIDSYANTDNKDLKDNLSWQLANLDSMQAGAKGAISNSYNAAISTANQGAANATAEGAQQSAAMGKIYNDASGAVAANNADATQGLGSGQGGVGFAAGGTGGIAGAAKSTVDNLTTTGAAQSALTQQTAGLTADDLKWLAQSAGSQSSADQGALARAIATAGANAMTTEQQAESDRNYQNQQNQRQDLTSLNNMYTQRGWDLQDKAATTAATLTASPKSTEVISAATSAKNGNYKDAGGKTIKYKAQDAQTALQHYANVLDQMATYGPTDASKAQQLWAQYADGNDKELGILQAHGYPTSSGAAYNYARSS